MCFVNGRPLGLIELKNPAATQANVMKRMKRMKRIVRDEESGNAPGPHDPLWNDSLQLLNPCHSQSARIRWNAFARSEEGALAMLINWRTLKALMSAGAVRSAR